MSEAETKEGSGTKTQPSGDGAAARRKALHDMKERVGKEAHVIAEEAGDLGRKAARMLRKPSIGAVVAGAAVLVAGAAWGASEAAVAAIAAYAVFRMLRRQRHPAEEVAEVESERKRVTSTPASQP